MKPLLRQRGFTLLEMLVVTALVAAAIGMSTLGMAGLSAESRLRSAGDQLATTYSLAQTLATRTGLVVRMECSGTVCRLRQLQRLETGWEWSEGQEFSFPAGTRVTAWGAWQNNGSTFTAPSCVPVSPGYVGEAYSGVLQGPGGLIANVTINGMTGDHETVISRKGPFD
ncbi:MAG: prepilin-type N-terminal cleavage/methylation domain-containing protein [Phycisphaerae bacterium]|nr:prepilin-type N-terminal cleavage/methylation domain-containing protein [Phycisphaerae bacterium]